MYREVSFVYQRVSCVICGQDGMGGDPTRQQTTFPPFLRNPIIPHPPAKPLAATARKHFSFLSAHFKLDSSYSL